MYCYILSYDLKSFSLFLCSLLFKSYGCFSPWNVQSFSPFSCLIITFPWSLESLALACWQNSHSRSSLFCCCLLSAIIYSVHSLLVFFISSNRILQSPDLLKKRSCNTVSCLILQSQRQVFNLNNSNHFLLQSIYDGQSISI